MLYFLLVVCCAIGSYFGHWWIVVPISMALNYKFADSAKSAFAISALALSTVYMGYSAYLNLTSDVNLVDKIAQLFSANSAFLSKIPATGLVFTIIGILASLVGGFAGWSGFNIKKLILEA